MREQMQEKCVRNHADPCKLHGMQVLSKDWLCTVSDGGGQRNPCCIGGLPHH